MEAHTQRTHSGMMLANGELMKSKIFVSVLSHRAYHFHVHSRVSTHNWCRTQFEKAVNLSAINPSGLQQLSLKLYGIILQHTFEKKEFLVNPKIFLVF